MMTELLDREEAMAAYREEIEEEATRSGFEKGLEKGFEQGIEQGKVEVLAELVREGSLSAEGAAAKLGVDVERFNGLVAKFVQS